MKEDMITATAFFLVVLAVLSLVAIYTSGFEDLHKVFFSTLGLYIVTLIGIFFWNKK